MSKSRPIVYASLGGLAVALLNFCAVVQGSGYDLGKLGPSLLAGYAVNAGILVALGAIVGALNGDERKAHRLFQLGAGAPALLGGLLQVASVAAPIGTQVSAGTQTWLPVPEAHAQTYTPPGGAMRSQQVQTYAEPSPWQLFVRGFLGSRHNRAWYVVVERRDGVDVARKRAQEVCRDLAQRGERRVLGVYGPYKADAQLAQGYSVAIGPLRAAGEATRLRDRLAQFGYPSPFVWTPPAGRP